MYFLGIDIGKRTHVASLMSEEGKVILKGFSFPNTTEGADSLIERLSKYSEAPADFVVGMEATGHYWLAIFSYLHESDFLIHVVNPLQTDGWRKGTEIRKRKNDIIDSVLIADLMRYGSFVETVLSDENVFSLKQLSRYRVYLVGTASDFKRKIIAVLDQVFPEYASIFTKQGIFGKASKELLLEFSSPVELEEISAETLAQYLAELSRNQIKPEKADQLKQAASNSFGVKFAQEAFTFQLRSMIEQLKFIESQVKETEKEIKHIMSNLNSVILTIPGSVL